MLLTMLANTPLERAVDTALVHPQGASPMEDVIKIIGISGGIALAIVFVAMKYAARIRESTAREQTRREIAAYIAEGTMTVEQGERLMAAGERPEKR
jgi:hypothetical protein